MVGPRYAVSWHKGTFQGSRCTNNDALPGDLREMSTHIVTAKPSIGRLHTPAKRLRSHRQHAAHHYTAGYLTTASGAPQLQTGPRRRRFGTRSRDPLREPGPTHHRKAACSAPISDREAAPRFERAIHFAESPHKNPAPPAAGKQMEHSIFVGQLGTARRSLTTKCRAANDVRFYGIRRPRTRVKISQSAIEPSTSKRAPRTKTRWHLRARSEL
jgi:hypothetical protein